MPCNNSIKNSFFKVRQFFFPTLIGLGLLLGIGSTGARAEGMADNPEVQLFISEMVKLHDFDETDLQQYFSRVNPDSRVLKLISPPTHPAQRSWQRYRSRFIENTRINNGVRFWRENAATLAKASVLYGVPEEVIVAIIGIETLYGRDTGSFNVFEALATLAFYYPQRAEYFRQELEQLLLMARENRTSPVDYSGSYAGALGVPQFMPGSLRRYAVDFDGDGRIDL
ncbi:MAG: lytic murein transglycosylase, partial [Azovibrio sp.]